MTKRPVSATEAAGHGFVMTRIFDAPRELVFKVWTEPEHVAQWFGPVGFTTPVCEMDVRPGGAILIHMQGPDGVIYPNKGVFHDVVEPERLVFTTSAFEDDAGVPRLEARNTVTFAEHNGQTHVTLHAVVTRATPDVSEALEGMEAGWSQTFDKLTQHLGQLEL